MKYPLVSVVIATYNSEKTLVATLDSLKKQIYPSNKIEILIIDGGSTDATLQIARRYKTKIIPNPKTELIYAKYLGFYQAKGKYLIFLDSDEILDNKKSIQIKVNSISKNPYIRAVLLGGYKTLKTTHPINNYINEFGDPFSFFIYRESKGNRFLISDFSQRFSRRVLYQNQDCLVIDFQYVYPLPLIELWAGGSMIDLQYARKAFPQIKKNPGLLAHLFYLLNDHGSLLAISKNDFTCHNSVPNLTAYFKKIASRVKNNVFNTDMGQGGFGGRNNYQNSLYRFKKYAFILYALLFIWPVYDGLYLSITRRKLVYLLHLLLTWYTMWLIGYFNLIKIVRLKIDIGYYGK
jgi:glycosyltransferase involved in cell wall biosynthesis